MWFTVTWLACPMMSLFRSVSLFHGLNLTGSASSSIWALRYPVDGNRLMHMLALFTELENGFIFQSWSQIGRHLSQQPMEGEQGSRQAR